MLNRRAMLIGAAAGLGAAFIAPLEAFAASWVTLGSRTVDLFGDHDTIHVGAGSGLYNRLRVSVSGNAVFMQSMKVTFANGSHYDAPLRFMFLPHTASRSIDLPGTVRYIRRVDFRYRKFFGGGRATVTLEGRRV